MVFHYLASVPACATVVLLHCSHVLFCACVFPFLYLSCLSAWRLQTPLVLTGLIWFRSSHSRALSLYGPLASCSFFVLPQCLTVLLVPLIVSMCFFFFSIGLFFSLLPFSVWPFRVLRSLKAAAQAMWAYPVPTGSSAVATEALIYKSKAFTRNQAELV